METTLYADILILMNFSMDFISLWAAALLCHTPRKALRMSLAALTGAIGALGCTLLSLPNSITYAIAALLSLVMCLVAFGFSTFPRLLYETACVWVCGALISGIMSATLTLFDTDYTAAGTKATPIPFFFVAITAAVTYLTIRLIRRSKSRKAVDVTIQSANKTVTFQALCDSGNLLRDPLSGDMAMVVSKEILTPIFSREIINALLNFDTETLEANQIPIRIIPRKTADKTAICCATTADKIYISSKKQKYRVQCLILPTDCPKNHFAGNPASIPTDLLK